MAEQLPVILTDKAVEIIRMLGPGWPIVRTLTCSDEDEHEHDATAIERFVFAVYTLRDLGLIACDALSVTPQRATAIECALTPRGREYYRTLKQPAPHWQPAVRTQQDSAFG
ncbi:hypothetical protein BFL28_17250 [Sphingomonas turrisvirgatae]|uniref:Uncharacterized protein n=2 Tax=Sphingomonas turrisvirgatae TaxID=1888892 RepID=A0A1E3LUX7_9SPHN|nr:hypothetical protein BFL28_17250 [Sphingomonas turrisvirgatae]